MAPIVNGRYRLLAEPGEGTQTLPAEDLLLGGVRELFLLPPAAKNALDHPVLQGRVRHPFLVEVYESGCVERGPQRLHGSTCVVSERLDGVASLFTLGEERDPSALTKIAEGSLVALEALHALGVCHGDLTPERILLFPGGIKLAGAGFARLGGEESPHRAPEVRAGVTPDTRSDLYSLGSCLYQAVTGRLPDPVTRIPVAELRPEVPATLTRAIAHLLEPEPRARNARTARGLLSGDGSACDAPLAARVEPAFVGRERALASITEAVEEATALAAAGRAAREASRPSGASPLLLVTAPEGLGKSRLLLEAASRLTRSGTRVLWAQCFTGGGSYSGWRSVIDRGARWIEDAALTARAKSSITQFEAAGDADTRHEHVARLLLRVAERHPTCLFLDDAHLLDAPSVDLLIHVARAAAAPGAGGALALVLGVRSDPDCALQRALEAPLAPACGELALGELTVEEAVALVGSVVSDANNAPDVSRLARLGGGSPFLLVELAREWRRGGGTPASVREALSTRLDEASPAARALLDHLAVLGRPATLDLALALGEANALERLDELVSLGLLRPGGEGAFAFRNEVTRRILLDDATDEALQERAGRVLAALSEDPGATAGERARLALLARTPDAAHLALEAAAHDPAPQELYEGALDLLPAGAERLAAQRLLAEHLLARGAFAEARRALEVAALDLDEDTEPDQLAAYHLIHGEVASAEGETRDAIAWVARGRAALEASSGEHGEILARLHGVEARALTLLGDHSGAAQRYAQARAAVEGTGDAALSAKLQIEEAQSLVLSLDRTRYEDARRQIEAAHTQLVELGDQAGQQHAQRVLGNHAYYSGDTARAERCFRRALTLAERQADLSQAAGMLNNLGLVAKERGALRQAEGYLERSLDIAERIGQPAVLCRATTNVGRVRRELGDLRGAKRSFRRAARVARRCGDAMIESAALSELGNARLAEGRTQAALHALRRSRRLRLRLGDVGRVATSELELGELWRAAGDVRAALSLTTRALCLQASLGDAEGAAIAVEAIEFAVGRPGGPAALLIEVRSPMRTGTAPPPVLAGLARGERVGRLALRLLAAALTGRARDAEQAGAHASHTTRLLAGIQGSDLSAPIQDLSRALGLEARAVVAAAQGDPRAALANVDAALELVTGVRRGALRLKRAFLLLAVGRPKDAARCLEQSLGQPDDLPLPLAERRSVGQALIAAAVRRAGEELRTNDSALISLAEAKGIARRLGDVALLALVAASRVEESAGANPHEAALERAAARIAARRLANGLPASLRENLARAAAPVPDEDALPEALAPDQNVLLSMVSRVLGTGLELEPLLKASMDALLEETGAERGLVALRDSKTGEVEMRAARQIDPQKVSLAVREVIMHVVREGISVRQDDATRGPFARGRGTPRSILATPVRSGDALLGVVYLDHVRKSGAFDQDDATLVSAFASRIAEPIAGSLARDARMGELARLADAYRETVRELGDDASDPLVGRSPGMRALKRLIQRYGNTNAPVTILGESGTGKELVAQAVHLASKRSALPFIVINCAAMPDTLLETELFGVIKGAFTGADRDRKGLFELAHEGTLFLDEVGDMSLDMQAKLLRVLESGELRRVGGRSVLKVDVRVVSATHRDLRDLLRKGVFREDLYYRLNVLRLDLPPLRERREDIPLLCAHFLQRAANRDGGSVKSLMPETLERLTRHEFPGNVRELQNIIERACALEPGDEVSPSRLGLDETSAAGPQSTSPGYHKTFQFKGIALNRRQRTLLDHLREGVAAITNRDYCALVSVSERTGLRDLTHLVGNGILRRIGKRKGARYQLCEAGAPS